MAGARWCLAGLAVLAVVAMSGATGVAGATGETGAAGAAGAEKVAFAGKDMAEVRQVIAERSRRLQALPGGKVEPASEATTAKADKVEPASEATTAKADKVAAGTFFFYGDTEVNVGTKDIDWSGKHVKHQEWPAELNRFFNNSALLAAYVGTGDEKYAQAARRYIEDWMDASDPYLAKDTLHPGDCNLNMAIRIDGWGHSLGYFIDSTAFDDAFVARMLGSISTQARYLSRHLTPLANWRVAELNAIVMTSLRFPFMEDAGTLLPFAAARLKNAYATQFLPDGSHIEKTPSYARGMIRGAMASVVLGQIFPEADLGLDTDVLARAFDYEAQGVLWGLNDSTAPFEEPERLAELDKRLKNLSIIKPAETPTPTPPMEQVFPFAGQVFVRSGWEKGAEFLGFDAGKWGEGHSHLGRLSFMLRSGGRILVADPGSLTYEMTDPFGPYGKSTRAHSTVNVNGGNQSEADAELLRTEFTPETALVFARYAGGYWPGEFGWRFLNGHGKADFGIHDRVMFQVRGQYLLVMDLVRSDAGNAIENVLQMGPMDASKADKGTFAWWSENKDANAFVQLALAPAGAKMSVYEGSKEPLRGWVTTAWHKFTGPQAAPQIVYSYPSTDARAGVASAVLVVPYKGGAKPAYAVKSSTSSEGYINTVVLELPDGTSDSVSWTKELSLPVDDGKPFVTDATFVWMKRDKDGKPLRAYLLDGTYLDVDGKTVYSGGKAGARMVELGK